MPTITLTKEELMIVFEMDKRDEEYGGIKVVEESEWINDGKYDYQEKIFTKDGKFYRLTHFRTGSYYSEYYYEVREGDHDGVCHEVEQKEITITKWMNKND